MQQKSLQIINITSSNQSSSIEKHLEAENESKSIISKPIRSNPSLTHASDV